MKRFFILAGIVGIIKVVDMGTTWLYTPDFTLTVNPLRSLLPLWGFFLYQILVLALLWLGLFVHVTRPLAPRGSQKLSTYWANLLYGGPIQAHQWFTKTPKNIWPLLNAMGFLTLVVAIPMGILAIISNVLCFVSPGYLSLYQGFIHNVLTALTLVGTLAGLVAFVFKK